jgi:hypothetical protein
MKQLFSDLFSESATSLPSIAEEWMARQTDANVHRDLTELVNTVVEAVVGDRFVLQSLPVPQDGNLRTGVRGFVSQATSGLMGLKVRVAFDAIKGRNSQGVPERAVLDRQIERLRSYAAHLAPDPKDSATI